MGNARHEPRPAAKRQDIEALRLVSVFGVVWFHLESFGGDVAYAGLVAFILIAFHFQARASRSSRTIGARARRLLIPWIAWCIFYGAFNVARGLPVYPAENGFLSSIASGTYIHLWYLPFLFLALCAFDQADRRIDRKRIGFGAGLAALALLLTSGLWRPYPLHAPWAQYAHASIGVFAGAFLGRFDGLARVPARLLLAALFGACLLAFPLEGVGVPYAVGLLATAPLLLSSRDLLPGLRLGGLPECVLGVYLSHIFFAALFGALFGANAAASLVEPLLVFCGSLAFTFALRRLVPRFARWVT